MLKRLINNPYFIFLPILFFYVYIIFLNKWPSLFGDEIRYMDFAKNLLHGFYSPPIPHINLWNGPGYPIILVPFVALKLGAIYPTLMNAVFQYLALVFLCKSLRLVANNKIALILSLALAVYPNALSILPILYTEALTYFLLSSFIYCVTLYYFKANRKYLLLAGLVLGYLTLTKVIFGYVLVICLVAGLASLLFTKNRAYQLRSLSMLGIAFAVVLPYLVYTWHLTGKVFYWGNSGGMSLYWMSTPYPHEYGDWKLPTLTNNQYPNLFKIKETAALLKKNHLTEINAILKHNEVEQDELFKRAAIHNIKTSPLKFAANYYYNFSRMLFNFPYTYAFQDGAIVGNIIRGSLILWASLAGIILTWINRRNIIYPVWLLVFLSGVYMALSGALSAYPRQLDVMLPVLLFWLGFLAAKLPKIRLKFAVEENVDDVDLSDLEEVEIHDEEPVFLHDTAVKIDANS